MHHEFICCTVTSWSIWGGHSFKMIWTVQCIISQWTETQCEVPVNLPVFMVFQDHRSNWPITSRQTCFKDYLSSQNWSWYDAWMNVDVVSVEADILQEVRLPLWCHHFYFKTKNWRREQRRSADCRSPSKCLLCCDFIILWLWPQDFSAERQHRWYRQQQREEQVDEFHPGGWGLSQAWNQKSLTTTSTGKRDLFRTFCGIPQGLQASQNSVVLEILMNKWEVILCAVHAVIQQCFSGTTLRPTV